MSSSVTLRDADADARSRLNSNVSELDADLTENPSYVKTVTLLNEFYGQGR